MFSLGLYHQVGSNQLDEKPKSHVHHRSLSNMVSLVCPVSQSFSSCSSFLELIQSKTLGGGGALLSLLCEKLLNTIVCYRKYYPLGVPWNKTFPVLQQAHYLYVILSVAVIQPWRAQASAARCRSQTRKNGEGWG